MNRKGQKEDKILYTVVTAVLGFFILLVAYPLIYVVSSSFSSGTAVTAGQVFLWPVDFSLEGYRTVFSHKLIGSAYRNTIFYTVAGTLINVIVTATCAYPLAREDFPMRKFFSLFFLVVMFFNGGMIPTYMVISKLKLTNTIWAMLLPGAISVYNMILVQTFIKNSIPNALMEVSRIDGCSDAKYFFYILLPLSKPVIAVIALYYAVGHWNDFYTALIYINKQEYMPLQSFLRDILMSNKMTLNDMQGLDAAAAEARMRLAQTLKYSVIIVSTVPVLCIYPFIQKYFVKGVMIGSVKG